MHEGTCKKVILCIAGTHTIHFQIEEQTTHRGHLEIKSEASDRIFLLRVRLPFMFHVENTHFLTLE